MPRENTDPPPAYGDVPEPLSGYRIALDASTPFPTSPKIMAPPCFDADNMSPVYVGSAIFENSVHPCKIAPRLTPACRVPYGGVELEHYGRYDLLPFDPDTMVWVATSRGRIPYDFTPIQGGYEENGTPLYHAIGIIDGITVPGKTGTHLGGCNIAFNGAEHVITKSYEILYVNQNFLSQTGLESECMLDAGSDVRDLSSRVSHTMAGRIVIVPSTSTCRLYDRPARSPSADP
ncbi:hypothetical protein EDC04DRAFT_1887402 [Pisolithus marmoratus]|nr:hypothetical protein EDC04DRAFT_1887402 [Pisolithus marmoratus]